MAGPLALVDCNNFSRSNPAHIVAGGHDPFAALNIYSSTGKCAARSSSERCAGVHLPKAPQDGFCKRLRCLDRCVVADARKVFEFEVCKELVEAVRPVLRKDWVVLLP